VTCARVAPAFAVVVAMVVVAGQVRGQGPQPREQSYVHESWTVRDGLPVNSINAILQDRTGYIWIATFDGLVRFDGVRFTVFNSVRFPELPSNRIVQLQEAPDGTLWLQTSQGHLVRFRDGRFTSFPFEGATVTARLSNLLVDSSGTAWLGNVNGLWKTQGDRLVRVAPEILGAPVTSIVKRRDGDLWIAAHGGGILRVGRDGGITKIATERAIEADSIVMMVEDRRGQLWVAGRDRFWAWRDRPIEVTAGGRSLSVIRIVDVASGSSVFAQALTGVFRVDGTRATLIGPPAGAFPNEVMKLWSDGERIWTVDGDGVFRNGRRVFTLPTDVGLTAALFDREGSLWLGSRANGLHRVKPALFTAYSEAEGLADRNVYPTYVDRAGDVWVGLFGTLGITRIDANTGHITLFRGRPPLPVGSVYQDKANRLWAGGSSGLYACELPTMACRAEGPPELRTRATSAIHGDAGGGMWVGAAGAVYRYDGRNWTSYPPSSGGPTATVLAFANTRDGSVWMGTNGGGLARYHNGTFTRVTQADGLPSDLIRALYVDADGWLWVGTEGRGLARIDTRSLGTRPAAPPPIVPIGSSVGLFDEAIHQILEDGAGRLWMNTNRGIFWVSRSELVAFADGRTPRIHSTAYSERDGLRNREGNGGVQPAGAKGLDGRLWFPTQDGVVVVDPRNVSGNKTPPPVVVEQVLADGGTIRPERDSVSLSPSQRDAQIEYTALTFLEPANVRFRYRLDNYDRTWVDAGSRRTAFYTKLPPGRYTFRVEASEASGEWHEPGSALAIRVLPQFWETAAFRWVAFATLGMLLFLGARWRYAQLRARAAHLELVVDERTATLRKAERELAEQNRVLQSVDEAKTRFFANVSHELRTPLTLTIGPLEDIHNRSVGDPAVERWVDIALRNSRRLLRLVNQLLDVAKLDAGALKLDPQPLDLAPFTRGIVSAFASVADGKGLRLTADAPDTLVGEFDHDAVEKILTNLISNAIKFTPNGGEVGVSLSRENGVVRWRVRDTGPGIPPTQVPHVFERFYRVDESATRTQPGTGIGLSLVKELLELHGGDIAVESSGAGTTFTATIPLRGAGAPIAERGPAEAQGLIARAVAITSEHDGRATAAPNDEPGENVPTLLVVDDSADLRTYIRGHFAPRFHVLEAADGAEGIELARRQLPDVVISDVMMPGTDGYELVRVLRSSPETDFLTIILLTAQAGDEERLAGLERGADDYMVKPFEMRELDVRVRNLVASRQRLRERFASTRPDIPPDTRQPVSEPMSGAVATADEAYAVRVRAAIRRGLTDPDFGVGELADAVAQDRTHLFRRVKDVFGESPSDVIRRARLEEAARLLVAESATVTDIAYAVGFVSLSHFCRRFQEAYGATPAAYRAREIVKAGHSEQGR
jgi:signal transduction histidine kinase/ligand-binding sensor domain-containing protein/AraC-like DNA-binding protein/ActR/RegA family two-component response regulator